MAKKYCYYCGKEMDKNDRIVAAVPLNTYIDVEDDKDEIEDESNDKDTKKKPRKKQERIYVDRTFHYNCVDEFFEKRKKEKKDKLENKDWDAVYQFFFRQILHVPAGAKPKSRTYAVERLLGLRVGKFMPHNTNTRSLKRGYSFRTILVCLKYCKRAMDKALKTVRFNDEQHKINYLMSIIINNIDFVQKRLDEMDRQNRRIEKIKKEEANRKASATKKTHYVRKGGGMNRFDWV